MKLAICKLKSVSPYSQSGVFQTPKGDKETHEAAEKRRWQEKLHVNADGLVFIPPMALKFALATAARMLRIQIPGKGKSEYTKHFDRGVLCIEPVVLGVKPDAFRQEWINANADGRRGSGRRVQRCFPTIDEWSATVEFLILDETVTQDVFERVISEAGRFVGVGMHRPENGGYKGRFEVVSVDWKAAR